MACWQQAMPLAIMSKSVYKDHKIYIIIYMKFSELLTQVGAMNSFDLPLLVQLSKAPRRQILVQLSQWVKKGRLVRLRRGHYAVAAPYRQVAHSVLQLAYELYRPSYLSVEWALSYYGIIPEKTVIYTNITTRVPRTFRNALGIFVYSHIKRDFFWGYRVYPIDDIPVWVAEPEKALLDYWHLHAGEWSVARLTELRLQNLDGVNLRALQAYAKKWGSPRLIRAVANVCDLVAQEGKGEPV